MAESVRNAMVLQRNLDTKIAYNATVVWSVQKYFNQKDERVMH